MIGRDWRRGGVRRDWTKKGSALDYALKNEDLAFMNDTIELLEEHLLRAKGLDPSYPKSWKKPSPAYKILDLETWLQQANQVREQLILKIEGVEETSFWRTSSKGLRYRVTQYRDIKTGRFVKIE